MPPRGYQYPPILSQRGCISANRRWPSLGKPLPHDTLFAGPWVYETGLLDEYAVNAYWAGHYDECLDACLKILATDRMKGAELQRIVANARYAWDALSPGLKPVAKESVPAPS